MVVEKMKQIFDDMTPRHFIEEDMLDAERIILELGEPNQLYKASEYIKLKEYIEKRMRIERAMESWKMLDGEHDDTMEVIDYHLDVIATLAEKYVDAFLHELDAIEERENIYKAKEVVKNVFEYERKRIIRKYYKEVYTDEFNSESN